MMESPLKKRRVSLTRSFDISPVKVAPDGGHHHHHKHHPHGTRTVSRRSATNLSPDLANLAVAARSAAVPYNASTSTTASLNNSRRGFAMDGANDEDIFDADKIGHEGATRKNMTPRSLASIALRNTTSNRGPRLSASPARSTRDASTDTANGKSGKLEGANGGSIAGEDQENLQTGEGPSGGMDDAIDKPEERPAVNHLKDANNEMEETIEPELPTLPAQLGLEEMPTPPQGLLSSSPSGKKQKRLARQRSTLGTSSLKQKNGDSESGSTQQADPPEEESQMVEDEGGEDDNNKPMEEGAPLQPSGPIITWDLEIERKQNEYEGLRREKTRLEAETKLLEGSLSNLSDADVERLGGRPDEGQLLYLLLSESNQPQKMAASSINDQLAAFLPFTVPQTNTEPQTSAASNPSLPAQTSDVKPYLQFFTPFKITLQSLETVPETLADKVGALQQRRLYSLASPDGLLEIELELLSHPITHDIASLSTKSISPWADFELGERFCRRFHADGMQDGNIATLGHGISRYWELASLRARVWEQAVSEHAELATDMPVLSTTGSSEPKPNPAAKGKGKGKGRGKGRPKTKRDSLTQDLTDEISSNDGAAAATAEQQGGRLHRSLHFGRRQLQLKRDKVALLFTWDIELDWTGEARSELDACVACPQSWRDRDKEAALDQVGELFHLLIRRQGVRGAIRAIVSMIFGADGLERSQGANTGG